MAKVTVNLVLAARSFPYGTKSGPLKVTLKNKANAEEVFLEQDSNIFVFEDVAVGDYDVIAVRHDIDGVALGDPITQVLSVTPTSTDIFVPINMAITQAP